MRKLFLLFVISISFLDAKIIEIQNFREIEKYVSKEALVIFDLDNTLMEPTQAIGSDQWFEKRIHFYKASGLGDKEAFIKTYDEWHKIQVVSNVKVIEKDTKTVFDKIQKNHSVIALTTRGFYLTHSTFSQLGSLSFNFLSKSPVKKEVFFDNGLGVLFKDGILFANGTHKGKALFKFLEQMNLSPKEIVFIDDKKSNVLQVEEMATLKKVKCTGLRYGYLDEKVKNIDPKLVAIEPLDFVKFLGEKEQETQNRG